ncbi:MAG: hypothetical protein H8D34_17170 [Chloroflexi bacterium]|nr:hypothetical protein [Chloroflexota bacterium]
MVKARRLPKQSIFGVLVLLAFIIPLGMPYWIHIFLGWPLWARLTASLIGLAPLGFLMGLPFPLGLSWLERQAPHLTPWAWAINGCASVIASVIAAIITLSYGFSLVMMLGAGAYLGAYLMLRYNISLLTK